MMGRTVAEVFADTRAAVDMREIISADEALNDLERDLIRAGLWNVSAPKQEEVK